MNEEKGQENLMMSLQNPETEQQPVSRRGFAKVAVAALAVAGFGTAALNGALARHGADDGGGAAVAAAAAADGGVAADGATPDATPSRFREVQPDSLYRDRTDKALGG
jgi:hypothetical protein